MSKDYSQILGTLNGDHSYLFQLKPDNIQEEIFAALDFLINKRQWTCIYLCFNRPYRTVIEKLEKKGFNTKRFFFIDTVEQQWKPVDNVFFASSSSALTQITLSVKQILQLVQSQGFIIIDSLEGLTVNNSNQITAMFIRSLLAHATKNKARVLAISAGGVEDKLLKQISPFFDKVSTPTS